MGESTVVKCLIFAIFPILLNSCDPKFYAPTTAPTPLFREKGETQISAHIGNGDEIDQSLQFSLASAISKKLSVVGSFYKAEGGFNNDAIYNQSFGRGWQGELALGYYKTLTSKLSYEIYGGVAKGNVTNYYSQQYISNSAFGSNFYPSLIKNEFIKPFIQGNIGRRSNKFDFIINMRMGYLALNNIENTESYNIDTGYFAVVDESINTILTHPKSFLLEPGITIRFGHDPLKIQVHMAQSINLSDENYPQENFIFSMGIVGLLNFKNKK